MPENPLISIITVVFNGVKTLEQTMQSVFNQTYSNIEYIIIDGGSTDGTLDIIEKYKHKIAYWVSEPDEGLYDAMNKGIKIATGELIGIVNSDDWYESNTVETVVENYHMFPHRKIFHGDMFIVDEANNKRLYKFNKSVFKFKYYGATYNHPTFFVTKDEYEAHKYNIKLKSVADIQFTLDAYLLNKEVFHYINRPLSNFRLGGVSGSLSQYQALEEGFLARKNAGMSLIQNLFSIIVRLLYWGGAWIIQVLKLK